MKVDAIVFLRFYYSYVFISKMIQKQAKIDSFINYIIKNVFYKL